MTPEIRPVCHGFVVDFQQDIIHIQRICQRGSCRYVKGGQIYDFRFPGCREQVTQPDFLRSADHAEGLHAAEFGIFDNHRLAFSVPADNGAGAGDGHTHSLFQVASAADDVFDLASADVCPADSQFVCVGMRFQFLDYADNHVVKTAGKFLRVLNLYGGHGQVIGQFFQINTFRDIYIILYP